MSARIADMKENAIVGQLTASLPAGKGLLLGAGDDCAIVERDAHTDTLFKTDCVVEGVHFTKETPARLIGRKALARAISDMAAMGGVPEHALVTLICDGSRSWEVIQGIYDGLIDLAGEYGVSIAGGETSSLPCSGLILSISITGAVPHGKAILRSTAHPGDLIAVTGVLGGTLTSGHHLNFTPRVDEANMLREHGIASAMMDLSDGLAADLPRMCEASHTGCRLHEGDIPARAGCSIQQALSDGEDYELLFTLPPDRLDDLHALQLSCRVSVIGVMTEHGDASCISGGWEHFTASLPK